MLEAKNISKAFGDNVLFENLSFQIEKGQKVCLSADSGKGKSTLIKMIMGLESTDFGSFEINGLTLNSENISAIRNAVAWLPQDLNLNINLASELVEYLELEKEKLLSFAEKLGLESQVLNQEYRNLSGGQKQRLLLSACLSFEKPILILDEPTSALDKYAIEKLITCIWEQEQLTVLSASHNADWLAACHQTLYINE